MSRVIFDRWVWIMIVAISAVVIIPLIVLWGLLQLPSELAFVAIVFVIVLWGVAAGYKDWLRSKNEKSVNTEGQI